MTDSAPIAAQAIGITEDLKDLNEGLEGTHTFPVCRLEGTHTFPHFPGMSDLKGHTLSRYVVFTQRGAKRIEYQSNFPRPVRLSGEIQGGCPFEIPPLKP